MCCWATTLPDYIHIIEIQQPAEILSREKNRNTLFSAQVFRVESRMITIMRTTARAERIT